MWHETTTEAITIVKASAQRLFPDQSLEQVLAELLLERARKNLIHYRAMASRFEEKYQQAFATFRKQILDDEPACEEEQDYFDWEMAVTGIADMETEIQQLQTLLMDAAL
jgi:translation initiation factor 2 alpha subunit (eIF-2alpha)